MVTKVGTQNSLVDALKDLVELDYDAVEAYEAAINRLDNIDYKKKLTEFKDDHLRHIKEVSEALKRHGENAPTGPSIGKQWITKGKVVLGNVMGDDGILSAMRSNEIDTNRAYERMNAREDKWDDVIDVLKRGLQDEHKHKAWLDSVVED
jgi:rubrerythrin